MAERRAPLTINMASIPVAGVGGLGLVALVVIIAIALQPARMLLLTGLAGGLLIACALAYVHRRRRRAGRPPDDELIELSLVGSVARSRQADDTPPANSQRLVPVFGR